MISSFPMPGIRCLAAFALLCGLCLHGVQAFGREAGWVPLEQSQGLAKQKLPATSPVRTLPPKRSSLKKEPAQAATPPQPAGASVYDGQPVVTERELYEFLELLPRFRAWARKQGEEAHPVLGKNGKPDFLYSPAAAQ